MNRAQRQTRRGGGRPHRAFALVLTIILTGLLATTGVQLATLAAGQRLLTARQSRALDHELAVRSALLSLPHLLQQKRASEQNDVIELQVVDCHVRCLVTREADKLLCGGEKTAEALAPTLRARASQHGLSPDSVVIRPIADGQILQDSGAIVWFDQLIQPKGLGEVFRWRMPAREERDTRVWSELVSLWDDSEGRGELLGLTIETTIDRDVRRHYVVCRLADRRLTVLQRLLT